MERIDVVKRGNRPTEIFDPEKLHHSIVATCRSVHTPDGQAEDIAKAVTVSVMQWCQTRPEITSDDIRRQAHQTLAKLHTDAAYLYEHHKHIV